MIHSHNRSAAYFFKRGYVDRYYLAEVFSGLGCPERCFGCLQADVARVRRVFCCLLAGGLASLPLPCSPSAVEARALAVIDGAFRDRAHRLTAPPGHRCVGDDFQQALARMHGHREDGACGARAASPLLTAMRDFATVVFRHLREVHGTVDDELLADTRACLWKGFALVSGAHLAACYCEGADAVAPVQAQLHEEMLKGV